MTREQYISKWWRTYESREGGSDRDPGWCKQLAERSFEIESEKLRARQLQAIEACTRTVKFGVSDPPLAVVHIDPRDLELVTSLAQLAFEKLPTEL